MTWRVVRVGPRYPREAVKFNATVQPLSMLGYAAAIVLSGDDTLCRKRGLGIFGTGMHHDALSSSKSKKTCHWGHGRVDLCIVSRFHWLIHLRRGHKSA
jgi:hypothetical protein